MPKQTRTCSLLRYQVALLCIQATWINSVSAYHSGAPTRTCDSMLPAHKPVIEPGKNPFHIEVVGRTQVAPGGHMRLTLQGKGETFTGFMMEVRGKDDMRVGAFRIPKESKNIAKPLECDGTGKAVTHRGANRITPLNNVTVEWVAPQMAEKGEYKVFYSVVHNYSIFWSKQNGPSIKISGSGARNSESAAPFFTLLSTVIILLHPGYVY